MERAQACPVHRAVWAQPALLIQIPNRCTIEIGSPYNQSTAPSEQPILHQRENYAQPYFCRQLTPTWLAKSPLTGDLTLFAQLTRYIGSNLRLIRYSTGKQSKSWSKQPKTRAHGYPAETVEIDAI